MLRITDLTYRIGGRVLLDGARLALPEGHHAGLVGRNGAGKTTLLRLIAGELHGEGGSIELPKNARIGMVAQEAPDGPESLIETVLAADRERARLLAEVALRQAQGEALPHAGDGAEDGARIAEIHARLSDIAAHAAPARAARILAGLGFDEAAQARPCRDFSGGWRMRVALAAVLFVEPDLLLLDEPTNHLDLEATLWLESFLKSYPHSLLLVSHDRDLLNRVVGKIVHLDRGRLTVYTGGYDRFERTRAERQANLAAQAAKQAARAKHMQAFVDRFRYKASKARQAQSRLKAIERMAPIAVEAEDEWSLKFDFPEPEPLAPPLIALDDVSVGYEAGKPVLRNLDLRIDSDDRIALLGANGNGKSTLAKLLAGRLKPMAGAVHRSGKLKVGYFAQHQQDELDLGATPLAILGRLLPLVAEQKRRAHLGRFGFAQDKALTRVGALSGGAKARLLFALMCREAPHILLLDEPTNHLDIDAREALVQALNAYEGAVVLISHDPHLIELTADRLWLVADGACRPFDGDMDDYRKLLLDQRRERKPEKRRGPGGNDRKDQRRAAARARVAAQALRQAAQQAEKRLEKLLAEEARLAARLADPTVYDGPTRDLMALQMKFGEVKKRVAAAEEAWLEAQAALD